MVILGFFGIFGIFGKNDHFFGGKFLVKIFPEKIIEAFPGKSKGVVPFIFGDKLNYTGGRARRPLLSGLQPVPQLFKWGTFSGIKPSGIRAVYV